MARITSDWGDDVAAFDEIFAEGRLRYRGRIDDSRTGRNVTRNELEAAVDDVLGHRPVEVPETEPFGCAVVW